MRLGECEICSESSNNADSTSLTNNQGRRVYRAPLVKTGRMIWLATKKYYYASTRRTVFSARQEESPTTLSSLGSGALRGAKGSRRGPVYCARPSRPRGDSRPRRSKSSEARQALADSEIAEHLRWTAEGGCPHAVCDALTLSGPRPSIQAGS